MNNDLANRQAQTPVPAHEKMLSEILNILNSVIDRYTTATVRYACMNNAMQGPPPDSLGVEGVKQRSDAPGVIHAVMDKANELHRMADDFENENNRLNQIIDGV